MCIPGLLDGWAGRLRRRLAVRTADWTDRHTRPVRSAQRAEEERMPKPGVPAPATGAAEFLAHARWMSDYHRARSQGRTGAGGRVPGLHGRPHGALARSPRRPLRPAGRAVGPDEERSGRGRGGAVRLSVLLQALRTREVPSANIEDARQLWRTTLDGRLEHDSATAFTEWLLHGHGSGDGPVEGESVEESPRRLADGRSALPGHGRLDDGLPDHAADRERLLTCHPRRLPRPRRSPRRSPSGP